MNLKRNEDVIYGKILVFWFVLDFLFYEFNSFLVVENFKIWEL